MTFLREKAELRRALMALYATGHITAEEAAARIERATPGEGFENDVLATCVHCHRGIKRVPGGHGSMWIHEDGFVVCRLSERVGSPDSATEPVQGENDA